MPVLTLRATTDQAIVSAAVCSATATFDIETDLNTVDPARVQAFELDPCMENSLRMFNGAEVGQGNCSAPNTCTCLCTDRSWLDEDNHFVELPWVDPLDRELLPGFAFGESDCVAGFMGIKNDDGSYRSCHLRKCAASMTLAYDADHRLFLHRNKGPWVLGTLLSYVNCRRHTYRIFRHDWVLDSQEAHGGSVSRVG